MADQPNFLMNKAEKLRHIFNEEKELGLEQTVTEEEIEECLKKAENIKAILSSAEFDEDEEYLYYKEEVKQADHTYVLPA